MECHCYRGMKCQAVWLSWNFEVCSTDMHHFVVPLCDIWIKNKTVASNYKLDALNSPIVADDVATGTTPLSSTNDTPSTTQVEIASADATDYKDKFRLCQLRTRPDFVGYGFDVVTERLRPTAEHYVGKVYISFDNYWLILTFKSHVFVVWCRPLPVSEQDFF